MKYIFVKFLLMLVLTEVIWDGMGL